MVGKMRGPLSNHNPNLSIGHELACLGSGRDIDPLNEYNGASMLRTNHIVCAAAIFCFYASFSLLFAQTPKKPAFEVATVKPIPSMLSLFEEIRSGKRSQDSLKTIISGTRIDIGASPMSELITRAYNVKRYQVVGPDWLDSLNYEIHAKLPEGVLKNQVPEMMQSLLAERFKLVVHRENTDQPVYLLTVSKDGHKLKEVSAGADVPAQADDKSATPWSGNKEDEPKVSRDGTMSTGKLRTRRVRDENGAIHMEMTYFRIRMSELAQNLSMAADRPIVDRTELTGFYEVSMEVSLDAGVGRADAGGGITGTTPGEGLSVPAPSGGGISRQLQKLGLRLEPGRAPVETLVIDSIEKNPIED